MDPGNTTAPLPSANVRRSQNSNRANETAYLFSGNSTVQLKRRFLPSGASSGATTLDPYQPPGDDQTPACTLISQIHQRQHHWGDLPLHTATADSNPGSRTRDAPGPKRIPNRALRAVEDALRRPAVHDQGLDVLVVDAIAVLAAAEPDGVSRGLAVHGLVEAEVACVEDGVGVAVEVHHQ